MQPDENKDSRVVQGFGDEWGCFTQAELPQSERDSIFEDYFSIFPWEILSTEAVGVDVGCGSGRWARVVAPRVGTLHVLDASHEALQVAKDNLSGFTNVKFHTASVDEMPFLENSLDFAYSLGVLHHVPKTASAICDISSKLKSGAPFLVYLYYAFDNRPIWYRAVWSVSESFRFIISRLPFKIRFLFSQIFAFMVYWPLARAAKILEYFDCLPAAWPLAYYKDKSIYTMRTDALDRFGTRLEQRFTRREISQMMLNAGFSEIRISEGQPYWCVLGIKK